MRPSGRLDVQLLLLRVHMPERDSLNFLIVASPPCQVAHPGPRGGADERERERRELLLDPREVVAASRLRRHRDLREHQPISLPVSEVWT